MESITRRDALRLGVTAAATVAVAGAFASSARAQDKPAAAAPTQPPATPPTAPAPGPNAKAAEAMFREGFTCAQAVLTCCGKPYGLSHETGCRMASGFAGGMGMMALTCGAATGAFMVIGLKHAQLDAKDSKPAAEANRAVCDFTRRFKELHGSITCKELLKHDISTPDGLKAAMAEGVFTSKCPILIRDAAAIVEDMLKA